jgi:signal transduction histidine kinase
MTSLGILKFGLLGLIGSSAIACALFLRWGWAQRRQTLARQRNEPRLPPRPVLNLGHMTFSSATIDAAAEIRSALMAMEADAARHGVRLESAVEPDLSLRTTQASLHALLTALIGHAIRQTPDGRVLVTGTRLGGRVQIAVMDDGIGVPEAVQQAALREVAQVVALQGGTLDIHVIPGEGGVVTVRLPEPMNAGSSRFAAATTELVEADAVLEWGHHC